MGLLNARKKAERFARRATAFVRDLSRDTGHRDLVLDTRDMRIGVGRHRKLIFKREGHLRDAHACQEAILKHLRTSGKVPEHYVLVPVRAEIIGEKAVQDFFHKPSVSQLKRFFESKTNTEPARENYLKEEEEASCKRFLKQNKGITLDAINSAYEEFHGHWGQAKIRHIFFPFNCVVLGQTRDGKIRLALIDV